MNDGPSTFRGSPDHDDGFEWNDSASLHQRDDEGVLSGFQAIRRGRLVELIRFVMHLPSDERPNYEIQKAGDRRFEWPEIKALAERPDFPRE